MKGSTLIVLLVVGAVAVFLFLIFGGGLIKGSSGSASGQAGSGGGLLSSGGAGGVTSNPSQTANPTVSGALTSNTARFGSEYAGSMSSGGNTLSGGGLIYNPSLELNLQQEEQIFRSSTYAPTTSVNIPTQISPVQNAPNSGLGGGISGGGSFWDWLAGGWVNVAQGIAGALSGGGSSTPTKQWKR